MRNYRNQERDKLPALFVHPPVRVMFSPYLRRLIECNRILRARLETTERHLKQARDVLGWSE